MKLLAYIGTAVSVIALTAALTTVSKEYIRTLHEYDSAQSTIESLKIIINSQNDAIQDLNEQVKKLESSSTTFTNFEVTYYNDYGITKSGRMTVENVTIAVDTKIIPLGSWVRITLPDGKQLIRRADDTGGAVKGKIIDVYLPESSEYLKELGRVKHVKVEVLN